jgi:bleomycin hydrolase
LVTTKLREHALLLRSHATVLRERLAHLEPKLRDEKIVEVLRKQKESYLSEIYKILMVTLGEPPKPTDPFTWEYYTAKGEYKSWTGTSVEFYKVSLSPYR